MLAYGNRTVALGLPLRAEAVRLPAHPFLSEHLNERAAPAPERRAAVLQLAALNRVLLSHLPSNGAEEKDDRARKEKAEKDCHGRDGPLSLFLLPGRDGGEDVRNDKEGPENASGEKARRAHHAGVELCHPAAGTEAHEAGEELLLTAGAESVSPLGHACHVPPTL